MADADDVRERCELTHWEPPLYDVDEPVWTAEDPDTGCMGFGRVEDEALGNLIAVVREYEDAGGTGTPYVKLAGETVERTWNREATDREGLLERLRGGLGL